MLRGVRATGWPSIATDLRNACALLVDAPVVSDRGIVTARAPEDVPAFTAALQATLV